MTEPQFSLDQNLQQDDENRITYFAVTDTRNKRTPFGIKKEDRSRHAYVIGKTGMGKSNLLENMAIQDIQNGEGMCFIDPHGEAAEKLLNYVPEDRVKDVLYFAPFDMQYPISFNVLENVDADKRHFVVAGLMSTFEKIWVDAWSARMAYILQNTLGALLEFPGATLLSVNRMYIDKEYRKNVIAHITDPSVRSFWVDEYSKYTDRYTQEATPAIQNKIGQFAANALVRNIIGQEESAFDLRKVMDDKKIFIVNLSKGRVGEGNANLLGSMLITKIYLAAMSRADVTPTESRKLPPFYLYVDEFQNFANRSFADILSEARKYKLALTVAHQYIEQMEDEVRAAVFGNVGTMMTFRVGSYDAEVLEKEFAPVFTTDDLVNLGRFQIYLKLMIDGVSSQPFSGITLPAIEPPEVSHSDRVIAFSRAQFSRPRAEVEKGISAWVGKKYEDPDAEEKERARQERRALRDADVAKEKKGPLRRDRGRTPTAADTQRTNHPPHRAQDRTKAPRKGRDDVHNTHANRDKERGGEHIKRREPSSDVLPQDRHDLRDMLVQITAEGRGAADSSRTKQEQKTQKAATPTVMKTRAPERDDGKGVTQEDKHELRSLLSSLTEQAPVKTHQAQSGDVAKARAQKSASAPPKSKNTPKKQGGADAKAHAEVPAEELKSMLHVDKPNLS